MNIWLYWETPKNGIEPEYIKLCREIIQNKCKNFEVNLVTPENLNYYISDIPFDINKIYRKERPGPQHNIPIKTAYLRGLLLKKYGGLWLDSDMIVLDSLDSIISGLSKYDCMAVHKRSSNHDYFSIGFLASRKEGKIISKYVEAQEHRLSKNLSLKWGEIGAHMLTPVMKSFDKSFYLPIEEKLVHPIPYQHHKTFFSKGNEEDFITNNTYAFVLFNNLFPDYFKKWSREQILNSDILISKIFRYALKN